MTVWAIRACVTLVVYGGLAIVGAGVARADIIDRNNYAAIILDTRGQVLHATNADEPRFPASLTKMMTLYMLFEAMRDGRVPLGTRIRMSAEAASRPPSKLGLPAGYSLDLEDAILALITRSANDVAAAIAEHLGGDEGRFAQMMTQRARSLGMTRTTFRNASGLPDAEQSTTARDMALLGSRLMADFPRQYVYFSTREFRWNNRPIHNHNHMLSAYEGADGIKTGYTRWSGFNIVTSARRDGIRLVGAVLGGGNWVERDRHMAELLDDGFQRAGVARRANSYDAAQTNRGASREAAGPRLVPGPRVMPGQRATPAMVMRVAPGRPAAQVLARNPRQPVTLATSAARPPGAARVAPPGAARAIPPPRAVARAATQPARAVARVTQPQPRAVARAVPQANPRPRAVELREPPRPNPARPITRT